MPTLNSPSSKTENLITENNLPSKSACKLPTEDASQKLKKFLELKLYSAYLSRTASYKKVVASLP
jgi:hypothetical protein